MGAIYRKEMRSYSNSLMGVLYVAFMLFMMGRYICSYCFPQDAANGFTDIGIVSGLAMVMFLYIPSIPIITMRIFADEKAAKTDLLLYSLPVSLTRIVMGKYLAVITVIAVPFAILGILPLIVGLYGSVNYAFVYSFILAMFLLGCALAAICVFVSSITASQAISAVLSIVAILVLYLFESIEAMIPDDAIVSNLLFVAVAAIIGFVIYHLTKNISVSVVGGAVPAVFVIGLYLFDSAMFEGSFAYVLGAFNVFGRTTNFSSEIFDVNAVLYFISVAVIFIFFTVQSLEKKRWSEVD